MVSRKIPAQARARRSDTDPGIEITNRPLLGVLERYEESATSLRPIYAWRKDQWHSLPEEAATIAWSDPPEDAMSGSLWAFTVDKAEDESASSVKLIGDPFKPYEVRFHRRATAGKGTSGIRQARNLRTLDNTFDDIEAFRVRYYVEGHQEPFDHPLMVSFRDQFCVGPLTFDNNSGCWFPKEDASEVHLFPPLLETATQQITVADKKLLLLNPYVEIGPSYAVVDLRPDNVVVSDTLAMLAVTPNRDAIAESLSSLESLTNTHSADHRTRRTLQLLKRIDQHAKWAEGIRRDILETEAARQEIEMARREAVEEARSELEAEIAEARQLVTVKQDELRRLEARKVVCEEALLALRTQAVEAQDVLVERTNERVAAAVGMAVAQALASRDTQPTRIRNGRGRQQRVYPPGKPLHADDLPSLLVKMRRSCPNNKSTVHGIVAAWACGLAPVLVGSDSGSVARAVAQTLCNGRLHYVPVNSVHYEAADLFGKVDAASGTYAPHPSAIADLVLDARNSEDLHIVAFDCSARCDLEAVLRPLLEAYSQRRFGSPSPLQIVHPYNLNPDDPYHGLSSIEWPENLLPMIILESGITLPVGSGFWRKCAVSLINNEQKHAKNVSSATDVSLALWRDLLRLPSTNEAVEERYAQFLLSSGYSENAEQLARNAVTIPLQLSAATGSDSEMGVETLRRALYGGWV